MLNFNLIIAQHDTNSCSADNIMLLGEMMVVTVFVDFLLITKVTAVLPAILNI